MGRVGASSVAFIPLRSMKATLLEGQGQSTQHLGLDYRTQFIPQGAIIEIAVILVKPIINYLIYSILTPLKFHL